MCERLARLGLPPEYVQALSPEAASARAGLPLREPAWLFTQGGWISPRGLMALVAAPLCRAGGVAWRHRGADLQREGEDWCPALMAAEA